jgi:hypothetical protein
MVGTMHGFAYVYRMQADHVTFGVEYQRDKTVFAGGHFFLENAVFYFILLLL